MRALLIATAALGLAACASAPKTADRAPPPPLTPPAAAPAPAVAKTPKAPKASPYAPAQEDPSTRGDYVAGGLYKPGVADSTPDYVPDVDAIPEPVITDLPRSKVGNRSSYTVLGKTYKVLDTSRGYVEQGLASYYGQKFHGRRTSNLEVYDMYAFTAAHKTLPLPSFVRVTNLDNGKSIVVRVNDRGPFHAGRIIDLSYAAAVKLDITHKGVGRVEVRAVHPDDPGTLMAGAPAGKKAMGAVSTSASTVRSALDRLVSAIPGRKPRAAPAPAVDASAPAATDASSSAGAVLPTAMSAAGVAVNAAAAASSVAAPANVGAGASNATGSTADTRFDMRQDGRAMNADEFDAWMKSRRIRVATGKPAMPGPVADANATAAANATTTAPVVAAAAPVVAGTGAGAITLQVASFGARANADRALEMLHGAGIGGARLQDGVVNGQPVWRLRVGPVAAAGEAELAGRVAALGFGAPRRVQD